MLQARLIGEMLGIFSGACVHKGNALMQGKARGLQRKGDQGLFDFETMWTLRGGTGTKVEYVCNVLKKKKTICGYKLVGEPNAGRLCRLIRSHTTRGFFGF